MGNRTIHLFVFDGLSEWETAYTIAHLKNAFRVLTVAATPVPVCTAGGLRVTPDLTLDQLRPANSALMILPDGEAWETGGNREAARKSREFLDAGVPVAAIG